MPPVRCIKPFGRSVPGDLADLPAGAAFDTEHWENVGAAPGGARIQPSTASTRHAAAAHQPAVLLDCGRGARTMAPTAVERPVGAAVAGVGAAASAMAASS